MWEPGMGGRLTRGTAIMSAAMCGHKDTVHVLKELGADVGVADEDGKTGACVRRWTMGREKEKLTRDGGAVLMRVAHEGRSELVAVLVELGADVNAVDKSGDSGATERGGGEREETGG